MPVSPHRRLHQRVRRCASLLHTSRRSSLHPSYAPYSLQSATHYRCHYPAAYRVAEPRFLSGRTGHLNHLWPHTQPLFVVSFLFFLWVRWKPLQCVSPRAAVQPNNGSHSRITRVGIAALARAAMPRRAASRDGAAKIASICLFLAGEITRSGGSRSRLLSARTRVLACTYVATKNCAQQLSIPHDAR